MVPACSMMMHEVTVNNQCLSPNMTDYIIALLVIIVAIFIIKKVATCLLKTIVAIIALAVLIYIFSKTGLLSL